MADKAQPEVTSMCKSWGLYPYKPPDLRFEKKSGEVSKEGTVRKLSTIAGQFDMMVFSGDHGHFWEVKTGGATAFAFGDVRQSQVDWYYREALPRGLSCWLIFFIGERAVEGEDWRTVLENRRHPNRKQKPLPKKCFLMPFDEYLYFAGQQERKSFSYEYAATELTLYEVKRIKGGWLLPEDHPFRKVMHERHIA